MSENLAQENLAQDEDQPTMAVEEIVRQVVDQINAGSVTFNDLLKTVAPKPAVPDLPPPMPTVAVITHAQRAAIERLPEVFGQVVPTEARKLQPVEVRALVEEKQTLDQLKKLVEDRHEGMRTTIFNHLDIEAEERGIAKTARRDKRGHYCLKGECLAAPGTGKKFTREVRDGSVTLNAEKLKALIGRSDLEFTHEDYLEMTTQTRVVDEHKVMQALKKNPSLINVIREATDKGDPVASLYLRNE
jgi:hypothetical protein